ncbi:HAD hydrolase family protein [Bradyrhizobium sp. LA2.1]|uniref:HAD hydrolase family protein n=1 Tax=Bradyrhizobium sp. LA2.1 TaxID=3156376 RepID=UPI003392B550
MTTPMAFALDPVLPTWGVWLFTAGGENPDIRAAFQTAVKEHARRIDVVTARGRSLIAGADTDDVRLHVVPVIDEKDGFLATHSLTSTVTSLLLASDQVAGHGVAERSDRVRTRSGNLLSSSSRDRTMGMVAEAWDSERDTLIILHDPALSAAAVMIETSCWEAGLCRVQRTDFRNFGHGRHVWLDRHADRTVLLSLTCDRSRPFWESIRSCIPSTIPRMHFGFGAAGRHTLFDAVLTSFGIVEGLGTAAGIDPGKPGVAPFGRTIYDSQDLLVAIESEDAATRRKRRSEQRADEPDRMAAPWSSRRDEFIERLGAAEFGALILDYDGTMVATDKRGKLPTEPIINGVRKLLDGGVAIALATGRGGSVGEELRQCLSAEHCERVLVGYYNGAYIAPLSEDIRESHLEPDAAISDAFGRIQAGAAMFRNGWLPKENPFQITIAIDKLASSADGLRRLREIVEARPGLKMVRSGHSIDICPVWAAKPRVLNAIRAKMVDAQLQMLAIGDSGDRHGNDYDLLGEDFGLSVDRVCEREISCWNLLPGNVSGPDGLLRILAGMRLKGTGSAQLDVSILRRP